MKDIRLIQFSSCCQINDHLRQSIQSGTIGYVAPEVLENNVYDKYELYLKSDLYSLGCSLFRLITGKIPFKGDTAAEIYNNNKLGKINFNQFDCKDVPHDLICLIKAMIEGDIHTRPSIENIIGC